MRLHFTIKEGRLTVVKSCMDCSMLKDLTVYIESASTSNTGSNMNLCPVFDTLATAGKRNTANMVGVRNTFR